MQQQRPAWPFAQVGGWPGAFGPGQPGKVLLSNLGPTAGHKASTDVASQRYPDQAHSYT